ncbi:type I 3-dehydroquinate dehydratase [Caloramator sp. E03]|uniref:type I 3-dehydroquinate dehydratase n=1 Tax=Caloramator sp. E03 TaxID=2576307 RepID=UPI0011107E6F|nr:type I 3-dehydroquinate dehydratase [Caloramator sp. E03]QCX34132.1 type I 3-dehydroquinate dehydratase [Caloramator sp. E03]
MGKVVKVKDVLIGEGMPKICVPMVGETIEQLIEEANYLKGIESDVVEWRVDFYENVTDIDKVKEALVNIRKVLDNKPIIFTFRSAKEGGQREIEKSYYFKLNKEIASTKLVDIVDVELFNDENDIKELIKSAHGNGVAVIISNHDFNKTPSKDEIISRLKKAAELGADIPKIAVMPTCVEDVITLLDATRITKEQYVDVPIITMSMAGKGVISRLSGEIFGSSLTFGAAKKASAPGQISVGDLKKVIELIHSNL